MLEMNNGRIRKLCFHLIYEIILLSTLLNCAQSLQLVLYNGQAKERCVLKWAWRRLSSHGCTFTNCFCWTEQLERKAEQNHKWGNSTLTAIFVKLFQKASEVLTKSYFLGALRAIVELYMSCNTAVIKVQLFPRQMNSFLSWEQQKTHLKAGLPILRQDVVEATARFL